MAFFAGLNIWLDMPVSKYSLLLLHLSLNVLPTFMTAFNVTFRNTGNNKKAGDGVMNLAYLDMSFAIIKSAVGDAEITVAHSAPCHGVIIPHFNKTRINFRILCCKMSFVFFFLTGGFALCHFASSKESQNF